jgi:hypothetical protein
MLIEGCRDFDKKYPPGPAEVATTEEAVDDAIAKGVVELAPEIQRIVDAAEDQCRGHVQRIREERQAKAAEVDETNEEQCLILLQREITIRHDERLGEWILKQKNWPDDDGVIIINDEHIHQFIDALTDRLGYGRVP